MTKEQYDYINNVAYYSFWPDCISHEVLEFIGCMFGYCSRYGQSRPAVAVNNHSGVHRPVNRVSYADYELDFHCFAVYPSLEDCAIDFLLVLACNGFGRSELSDLELFKSKAVLCGLLSKEALPKVVELWIAFQEYCNDHIYFQSLNN